MRKEYRRPTVESYGSLAKITAAYGINGMSDQSDFPVGTLLPNSESVTGAGSIDACFGTGNNNSGNNDATC